MVSESFAFTCNANDESGQAISIVVSQKNVTIKLANSPTVSMPTLSDVWDGHMSGLVTAEGISIQYQDHYGCIRNVAVTGLLQRDGFGHIKTIKFDGCKGGSTPDKLCFRD
jgi:hypothetical protein